MDKNKELFRILFISLTYWLVIAPLFSFFTELGNTREVGNLFVLGLLIFIYFPIILQLIITVINQITKVDFILCYFSVFMQLAMFLLAYVMIKSFGELYFNYFIIINCILIVINVLSVKVFYKKFV